MQKKIDLLELELQDYKHDQQYRKTTVKGTYEDALVEEMDKMKMGFEKKIKKLLSDHE